MSAITKAEREAWRIAAGQSSGIVLRLLAALDAADALATEARVALMADAAGYAMPTRPLADALVSYRAQVAQ